jgi:hypothetical protein
MQKIDQKPESPPASHFSSLNIEILEKQKHLLFQTVNQLRHQLTQLQQTSGEASNRIQLGYVHRILNFLLTSLVLMNCKKQSRPELISERKKVEISRLISDILDRSKGSEEEVKKQMQGFVNRSLSFISEEMAGQPTTTQEQGKGLQGRDLADSVYNFFF